MILQATDTPLQLLRDDVLEQAEVTLRVKRLDMVHPIVSGNKWYKLKYNLQHAQRQGYHQILSFGGAYSNHIHALAGASKALGLESIGVIRGEAHESLNDTLQFAVGCGMQLHYLNRADYRLKYSEQVLNQLKRKFGDFFLLPEGGSNALALKGVAELVSELGDDFDLLCCACGSGGTMAGLIAGLDGRKSLEGYAALKGADFLYDEIRGLLVEAGYSDPGHWGLNLDYHFGGFAKTTPLLLDFIRRFEAEHGIPLEPLYTGKLFYGLYKRIAQGVYPPGSRIIAIHSGGLQGRDSLMLS